jgi:2-dehydropantoate 2-reductase
MIRVLIQGAGAVGSYLGARLALAGAEVAFVARGQHLEAMRREGLRLVGPRGDALLEQPLAFASVRELPWVPEVCFLAVKTYDVAAAAADLTEAVAGGAVVVTLQNGVAGASPVLEALPEAQRATARVVAGLASVSAVIAAPGLIRYTSDMSSITAAPFPGGGDVEARLRAAMEAAGMPLRTAPDIRHALWRKFLSLATNAALTSLARAPAGSLYHDPDSITLTRRAIAEVGRVARAEGVAITAEEEEAALAQLRSFPADMYASMYHDVAAGKRLEVAWLSGTVARLAARHGIDAPVHTTAWICLRPHADPSASASRSN